jgi:hypothetical protein
VSRAIGFSWTDGNATCIAGILICVINAVLHVALDTLDVLSGVAFTFIINLLVFHLYFLFS